MGQLPIEFPGLETGAANRQLQLLFSSGRRWAESLHRGVMGSQEMNLHVRFGSLAVVLNASNHVRFRVESGRKWHSLGMSAFSQKQTLWVAAI